MNKSIELKNVCHSFNGKQVLCDISLDVRKGEIIGLLGPSGAGKTTLINIMTGQLKPDGGDVFVNGTKIGHRKQEQSEIGIVMDSFGLYERFSVYDNLKFYAQIFHVPSAKIDEVLDRTGLLEAKKVLVSNLSKGMRSRVNLCRALLKEIKILFLDEPTSGLDPETSREIHSLLLEQKEKGTTIFLTTHNMYEAAKLCDHVALLNQGKIVEYGAPSEICKRYNHLDQIVVERKCGKVSAFRNSKESAGQIASLLETEDILTIHSSEPDLERVFLELTGRKFT